MLHLESTPDGLILPIQAQPKARRNGVTGAHAGRLRVAVTAPPEKGKANKAIVQVLAAALNLKRSQLSIVAGTTSSQKKCLVTGVTADDLQRRLSACIGLEEGG